MIIFKVGGDEKRGCWCVRPGGFKDKTAWPWPAGIIIGRKVTFGAENHIVLLERKALITEKKRLSLAWPDDISGQTCMYLKASFIHVVSITSREAAVGDRIRYVWQSSQERMGKWFGQHSPTQKPHLTSVSIPKITGFFFHQIPLMSQRISHDQCSSMATLSFPALLDSWLSGNIYGYWLLACLPAHTPLLPACGPFLSPEITLCRASPSIALNSL